MAAEDEKVEYLENPPELKGVYDLSMLVYLEMYHVLVNLKARYSEMSRKHPYTQLATILVAVNPYERLPIYTEEVMNEFFEAQKDFRPVKGKPHPFGVASRAYQRMVQRGIPQSTIVCGESGAGKSETAKLMMRYLATTSGVDDGGDIGSSMIEQQIIAASPILEAFGNAKTVYNNNSSRFGKFTKLLYERYTNRSAGILGSYLETYLLEKSRVVSQAKNERNYHVFYFMFNGLDEDQRKEMGLHSLSDFFYVNQGKCPTVAGISDTSRFEELKSSLKTMRIELTDQSELWKICAGIMHLGNVSFKPDAQDFASVDEAKCKIHLDFAAKFWSITSAALKKRLTTKSMKVMRKTINKPINIQDAKANRDAISKAFFENCFLWLSSRINAELFNDNEDTSNMIYIGVLDVFGFENFKVNSLEQFCINFTNEKLQAFFNENIIASEQEEYMAESVFWTPISVPNNDDLIKLIEDKNKGLYRALNDTCRNAKPDIEAFYMQMTKNWRKNKTMKAAKPPKSKKRGKTKKWFGLILHHYAEPVKYNLMKWIEKNMDAIHNDTNKMFKKSKSQTVKNIGGKKWKRTGKGFSSVTSVFHKGITTLMANLKKTEPYFVRCVNPNAKKSPTAWEVKHVEKQLRSGGLIEALKVLKLGYPTRVPYQTLYDKYHGYIDNPLIQALDAAGFAEAILIAFEVTKKDYELGLTKIFFKPAKASILDEIMDQAGKPLTEEQNKRITDWVVGKRWKQMQGTLRLLSRLATGVRKIQARKNWNTWGRVGAVAACSFVHHLKVARYNIEKRKRNAAANEIQSFWRGSRACIDSKKRLTVVKESVNTIYDAYRKWEMKQQFFKWLTEQVEEVRAERERERIRKEKLEREAREKKLAAEERERQRLAEEKRQQEEEKRRQIELRKQADERERKLALEKMQEEERKRKEEEERIARAKKAEEDRIRGEQLAKEEAERKRKAEAARVAEEQRKHIAAADEALKRKQLEKQAAQRKIEEERQIKRDEAADANFKEMMPEMVQMPDLEVEKDDGDYYADEDGMHDSSDGGETEPFEEPRERDFKRLLGTGQLFLKHTGKKRRKPQDRFVKVSFESNEPRSISWGSGSRHINFDEIQVIAWGHYTPVFQERRHTLDEKLCFSVIGKEQILDLSATDKTTVDTWVKGLRKLKGMTAEESDQKAKEMMQSGNMPGRRDRRRQRKSRKSKNPTSSNHNRRTKSLMLLQQDLFVMTCTTVFRNLEEEGRYNIDPTVRDRFNPKQLYEQALKDDIPWRQWNTWIRQKIVDHLEKIGARKEVEQYVSQNSGYGPGPGSSGQGAPAYYNGGGAGQGAQQKKAGNNEECQIQ